MSHIEIYCRRCGMRIFSNVVSTEWHGDRDGNTARPTTKPDEFNIDHDCGGREAHSHRQFVPLSIEINNNTRE